MEDSPGERDKPSVLSHIRKSLQMAQLSDIIKITNYTSFVKNFFSEILTRVGSLGDLRKEVACGNEIYPTGVYDHSTFWNLLVFAFHRLYRSFNIWPLCIM